MLLLEKHPLYEDKNCDDEHHKSEEHRRRITAKLLFLNIHTTVGKINQTKSISEIIHPLRA